MMIKFTPKRFFLLVLIFLLIGLSWLFRSLPDGYIMQLIQPSAYSIGDVIDSHQGVDVYYNGKNLSKSHGRNVTTDGYNLGQKYQCVEYIKRYYYQVYQHKMPDSYGHAYSFFNPSLADGEFNQARALLQFTNPSKTKPQAGDIIVIDGRYGHVAIITEVSDNHISIIQQNMPHSRATMRLHYDNGLYTIEKSTLKGWLRIKE